MVGRPVREGQLNGVINMRVSGDVYAASSASLLAAFSFRPSVKNLQQLITRDGNATISDIFSLQSLRVQYMPNIRQVMRDVCLR